MPGLAGSGGSLEGIGGALANGCDCCHGTPPECPTDCTGLEPTLCLIFRCNGITYARKYDLTGCTYNERGHSGTITCSHGIWTLTSELFSGVHWSGSSPYGPWTLHHTGALPCDDLLLLSDSFDTNCDACTCSGCCLLLTFAVSGGTITFTSDGTCVFTLDSTTGTVSGGTLTCFGDTWWLNITYTGGSHSPTTHYAAGDGTGCPPVDSIAWFNFVGGGHDLAVACFEYPTAGPCDSAGNCVSCCTQYSVNFSNGGSGTFGPPISATCQWNGTAQTGAVTLAVNIVAHDNDPCYLTMRIITASGFQDFEAYATEANGCPPLTGWVQTAGVDTLTVTSVTRTGCP